MKHKKTQDKRGNDLYVLLEKNQAHFALASMNLNIFLKCLGAFYTQL